MKMGLYLRSARGAISGIALGMSAAAVVAADEAPDWGETVSITYPRNQAFIAFLEERVGRVVSLDVRIGMSVSIEGSYAIVQTLKGADGLAGIDAFMADASIPIPLDGLEQRVFLVLELIESRELDASYGGTGVVQFPLAGRFRVGRGTGSGGVTHYVLAEQETGNESD